MVVINVLVLLGTSIFISPGITVDSLGNDVNCYLQLIPIAGIAVFVGLISGYIPSPLYRRNERWPTEYAIPQLILLLLTASRLTRYGLDKWEEAEDFEGDGDGDGDDDDYDEYEYDYNIRELASFTSWLGTNCFKLFYKERNLLTERFMEEIFWFGVVVVISYVVTKVEWLNKIDETKNLSLILVFFRNFFLHAIISIWFIWEDLNDPNGIQGQECRTEHGIAPGLIAPDYPYTQLVSEFMAGWKIFHLSDLWLVRLSHAILYPSIILLYTRRPLTVFLIWTMFIEIDFFHALADMFHYVSGPELAEERQEFMGDPHDCYVNVQLVQTLLAYPLNFLYLSTSYGDTPPLR